MQVKFLKQWRGHAPGAVVELTEERAKQLIYEGYCCEPGQEPRKRGRPAKPEEAQPNAAPGSH